MIEVADLAVRVKDQLLISEVSFHMQVGQWLMICGPNGSGKTSLVKALTGEYPAQGKIILQGQPLQSYSSKEKAKRIGFLDQQHPLHFDHSLEDLVALGRYAYRRSPFSGLTNQDHDQIERAIDQVGLSHLASRSLTHLSGGELQRAFLAQVFAQDPQLLVLDEPGNHLDLVYEKELFGYLDQWLSKPGRALISVVHDLSIAKQYADQVLLMHQGLVKAFGPPQEVLTSHWLDPTYQMDVVTYLQGKYQSWQTE